MDGETLAGLERWMIKDLIPTIRHQVKFLRELDSLKEKLTQCHKDPVDAPSQEHPANPPSSEDPVDAPSPKDPVDPPSQEHPGNTPSSEDPVDAPSHEDLADSPCQASASGLIKHSLEGYV